MSGRKKKIDVSRIDPQLVEKLPQYIARRYSILPLFGSETHIVVATPNGYNDATSLQPISDQLKSKLIPYDLEKFTAEEVKEAIDELYKGRRMRLGELLVLEGVLTEEQLDEALRRQAAAPGRKIGDILQDLGYTDEQKLQEAFAAQIGYKFLPIHASLFLDLELINMLPKVVLEVHRVLPIRRGDGLDDILLLSADEVEDELIELMKKYLGVERVETVLTSAGELEAAIESCLISLGQKEAREKHLGELLLERRLITQTQLDEAIREQKRKNVKLGELLVAKGLVPEQTMLEVVAEKLGFEFLATLPSRISAEFKELLSEKFATFNKLIPIAREGEVLVVAMADPQDRNLLSMLRQALNREIRPVLAPPREITRAIKRLYNEQPIDVGERVDLQRAESLKVETPDSSQHNTKRIINMVNNILADGVRREASDIHLTPKEDSVDLFYRLDGSLVRIETCV